MINSRDSSTFHPLLSFRREDLIHCSILVIILTAWSYRSNGHVTSREIFAIASLVIVAFLTGQFTLASLQSGLRLTRSFPLIWLTGLSIVGLGITLIQITTPMGLVNGFILISCVAFIGNLVFATSISAWSTPSLYRADGNIASLISLFAATFWMQHLFPQKVISADTVRFRIFDEYYSNTVNMMPLLTMKNPFAVGSIHYAGEPLSFYHWACYSPAALLHLLGGQPANDTMATLWFPLATYIMGLSAFVLGQTLFGSRAGLLAATGLVVLPDPTHWAANITVLSFERIMEASAGMGYACGAATVSLVLVIRGIRGARFAPMPGVLGAFASGLFKINIIVASLPATLFAILIFSRRRQALKTFAWTAFLLAMVGFAYIGGTRLRSAPSFALDPSFGRDYVRFLLALVPADTWIRTLIPSEGLATPLLIWGRSFFVLFATFQLLLPLYILAVLFDIVRNGTLRRADGFIISSLIFYALLAVLLIPNANGDPFELQHRDFCWYYMLVIIGLAGHFTRILRYWAPVGFKRVAPIAVVLTLLFPLALGRTMQMPARDFIFARGYYDSAQFIRLNTNRDDVFLDSRSDPWLVSTALTERRTFICRDRTYNFPGSAALKDVRENRWKESDELFQLNDASAIRNWSQRNGVRWVLVHPETDLHWPANVLAHPAFQSGEYRVFDLHSPEK